MIIYRFNKKVIDLDQKQNNCKSKKKTNVALFFRSHCITVTIKAQPMLVQVIHFR